MTPPFSHVTVTDLDRKPLRVDPPYNAIEQRRIVHPNEPMYAQRRAAADGSVGSAEAARLLGVSRDWVRRNALRLGGWKAPVGHWRFNPEAAKAARDQIGEAA